MAIYNLTVDKADSYILKTFEQMMFLHEYGSSSSGSRPGLKKAEQSEWWRSLFCGSACNRYAREILHGNVKAIVRIELCDSGKILNFILHTLLQTEMIN